MRDSADRLLHNLREQQQSMLVDDLERLSALVPTQEQLWAQVEADLAAEPLQAEVRAKIVQIQLLVETNQLLAQQSLVFAKRVLRALTDDAPYAYSGQWRMPPGAAINIRA
ncbi:MAG: hypothetical protein KGZ57_00700 [Dethiobacter sp.]|nr:hypothetical protein [Dethiobacter sp.]